LPKIIFEQHLVKRQGQQVQKVLKKSDNVAGKEKKNFAKDAHALGDIIFFDDESVLILFLTFGVNHADTRFLKQFSFDFRLFLFIFSLKVHLDETFHFCCCNNVPLHQVAHSHTLFRQRN
jgi:hypothetical protein